MLSRTLTLKSKLILLLLLSVGGSMLLAGMAISYFVTKDYEQKAQNEFGNFVTAARNYLTKTDQQVRTTATSLAEQERIISTVSFISDYYDINNYQPLVFDGEKQELARSLSRYARSAQVDRIKIYGKSGWLIAYTNNQGAGNMMGYLSFTNAKPVLYQKYDKQEDEWQKYVDIPSGVKIQLSSTEQSPSIKYVLVRGNLAVDVQYPIYRTYPDESKKQVGTLVVSRYLTQTFLDSLANEKGYHHSLLKDNKIIVGDIDKEIAAQDYSAAPDLFTYDKNDSLSIFDTEGYYISAYSLLLNDGSKFYLVSSMDKMVIAQDIDDKLNIIFRVFVLSAILVLIAGLWFAKRSIAKPVELLIDTAKQIKVGNYKPEVTCNQDDEFGMLCKTMIKMANTVHKRETELRSAHDMLEAKVKERTEDLKLTNEQLKKENRVRMSVEAQLQESRDMLQLVMDNIPQYVFWKDRDSNYLGCNSNFLKVAGLSNLSEIIGKSDFDLPWGKSEAESYRKDDKDVMDSDIVKLHIQETQTTADGKLVYVDTNKIPLHDENGNVIGVLGTYEDITERKLVEQELIYAKEHAEKSSKAKSEFLNRMSHELRTPLNAILGFSQLLEYDEVNPLNTQQKENVSEILIAGRHLLNLISEILDLARIESGKMVIDVSEINLGDSISECVSLLTSTANEKGISIEVDCNTNLHVSADRLRLKQVMLNLLNNAIKYNKQNGKVFIEVNDDISGFACIVISDTGKGISAENLDKLFNPFERLGQDNNSTEGTGIGLVITRDLIELMGGKIWVESEEGQGTTFSFTVPLHQ